MSIPPGAYTFGPENAALRVKTGRRGAAAKAGHDLLIEVESWRAKLEVDGNAEPTGLQLEADTGSLRVIDGTGGIQALSDDDRQEIPRTIEAEVLPSQTVRFRSTAIEAADGGGTLHVSGELEMADQSHGVEFELQVGADGRINGAATVKQSDWGIEPYSGLFGTLKVADEVEVLVETGPPSG